MSFGNVDGDFDDFRRRRKRSQARAAIDAEPGYQNSALTELEQVEAREVRDQQLTREVHDFFSAATRKAATIVERMAEDAVAEADQRINGEMEAFLIDSFARMNTLVLAMIQKRQGNGGEELLEPNVNNLVGKALDKFRSEGTAELDDKHIGKDPFRLELEDVRQELIDSMSGAEPAAEAPAAPIGEHLVAEVSEFTDPDEEADIEIVSDREAPEVGHHEPEDLSPTSPAEDPAVVQDRGPPSAPAGSQEDYDLERFKQALRSLVRQGTMTRDEARAAWAKRLESLGLK